MAKGKSKSPVRPQPLIPDDYWRRSGQPLHALLFLLPGLVAYELGALIYATDYGRGETMHVKARLMLLSLFEVGGWGAMLLPGVAVAVVLLGWHWARRDEWKWEPRLYGWMSLEAILWALPLFIFGLMLVPEVRGARGASTAQGLLGAALAGKTTWQAEAVFSVGAGIYEEMLFRFGLITLLHLVLVDWLALKDEWGSLLAMVVSSGAFALYHFSPGNPFSWSLFGFYTAAGFYLACMYILRGIGIAAGSHAFYDLLVVAWRVLR